jgi:hypothetical protein
MLWVVELNIHGMDEDLLLISVMSTNHSPKSLKSAYWITGRMGRDIGLIGLEECYRSSSYGCAPQRRTALASH